VRTVLFEKNIPKVLLTRALRSIWPDVVFTPLSPTRLVEIPDVPLPGPRWVRVRNRLGGICGSDLHLLTVEADPGVAPAALPGSDRLYLGHEVVGEVTEVGAAVASLKVGDRVTMDAHSQSPNCLNQGVTPPCHHCREGHLPLCENASLGRGSPAVGGGWGDGFVAHESGLFKIPDELDDETAVVIEPLSVGVRAALRRLPQPEERALVVGCGTIGLAVVEALRILAPRSHVTVMARYPHQVEMARRLGAGELIVQEDPYAAAAHITGGKLYRGAFKNRTILGGFDVVYDCVGTARTVQDSLRWARAGGAVVLVGISLNVMRVDLTPVWHQEVDLLGLIGQDRDRRAGHWQPLYGLVADLLLRGELTTEGFITHRYPLDRWREAARTALDRRGGAIKVILDYRGVKGP
jgi:threonine dehydrogenase-like Zn-dependent dehydrogenase